jgi:serine protease AprX
MNRRSRVGIALVAALTAAALAGGGTSLRPPAAGSDRQVAPSSRAAASALRLAVRFSGESFTGTATAVQVAALNPPPDWGTPAGRGVGVALVDTGVNAVPGLQGRVIVGPDLSGDGDGVDRHGHGTFMAGLIAGDGTAGPDGEAGQRIGVAPGAHIVSVKVAGRDGTTTVGTVVDAINWVVEHAGENGVRVLSLSFGVEAPPGLGADPLATAVERAWASGITVVASAGNGGAGAVSSPGGNPWVVTAGATDTAGTAGPADDTVPPWSGFQRRGPMTKPDVVAPGVSVISLRAPGSFIDEQNPAARVGASYFRGSGTSMSAALTAGAAAVLIEHHPEAVPDDVKGALESTARPVAGSPAGSVDLAAADAAGSDPAWWQRHPLTGDTAGAPRRMPWSGDDGWDSARWYSRSWDSARWYSARWYSARWYSARWYSARWYGDWGTGDDRSGR